MRTRYLQIFTTNASACVLMMTVCALGAFSQSSDGRSRNNPYSPSPKGKVVQAPPANSSGPKGDGSVSFVMERGSAQPAVAENNRPSIAQATFKIAKAAEDRSLSPTEIYKIGAGDVLYIGLQNSSQGSGYFTVRADGTIDYPLAGENVKVTDQTVEIVEENLASAITLFKDPAVEVKVRQYASHRVKVGGLVDNAGEKFLQREAMPLFAIRAEAGANPKATRVAIRRGDSQNMEVHELNDPKTEALLIRSGDNVEFTGDGGPIGSNGSYFIAGEIASGGQKELTNGLTLYQAIVASGGAKGDPKKAVIRRKNDKGLFNVQEHNLRSIKSGKSIDPFLAPGDVIEIGN